MVIATDEPAAPGESSRRARAAFVVSLVGVMRRHGVFLVVLAGAVGIRIAVLLAYPYPFAFPDTGYYVLWATTWQPDFSHPRGYSTLLSPFVPGSLVPVAILQHLMGLALVVAGYAFLVRRGVRPWLAALAVIPVAADDLQLTMEHFVSSDTLFTLLVAAALLVLARRARVTVGSAAITGVLLAAAILTRTVGQPLVLLVLGYLLVKLVARRATWLSAAAFLVAVITPLLGYAAYFHHFYGVYALDQLGGRALYSRAMSIADCDRLDLAEPQRILCLRLPPAQRPETPDYWGWSADSPANKYFPGREADPFLREFGLTVIKQQPLDYLAVVAKETSWHFLPKAPLSDATLCRFGGWRLPEWANTPCYANFYAQPGTAADRPEVTPQPTSPLRSALAAYSRASAFARGPLLGLGLLVTVGAIVWRPRRGERRHSLDALLFAGAGFGLILASVAFGMYEPRYAVTAVFLIPLGAVLALHRHFNGGELVETG